jgi:hypothetical protein
VRRGSSAIARDAWRDRMLQPVGDPQSSRTGEAGAWITIVA